MANDDLFDCGRTSGRRILCIRLSPDWYIYDGNSVLPDVLEEGNYVGAGSEPCGLRSTYLFISACVALGD